MLGIVIFVLAISLTGLRSFASEPELHMARATAYIIHGTCADGSQTRRGTVAVPADQRELLGKTILIYLRDYQNGNLVSHYIGAFEATDICPEGNMDIWCEDMDEAQELMNLLYYGKDGKQRTDGRIFYQVVEAQG